LSKEEIVQGYSKIFKNPKDCEEAVELIIKKIDADGNGGIDNNEFIAGTMELKNVINESNL